MKQTNNYHQLHRLHQQAQLFCGGFVDSDLINQQLLETYLRHHNQPTTRKTHHFMGRFENTYLELDKVPAMQLILDLAQHYATLISGQDGATLKRGFWFNEMAPGQQTSLHSHEENNEILSAVYYIVTPKDCGDLVVKLDDGDVLIKPQAGQMILFTPDLPHSVNRNNSDSLRLSVAINFGLDDD